MDQMATTIRIIVWSCLVLWTLGRAVPSNRSSPNQDSTLKGLELSVELPSLIESTDENLFSSETTTIVSTSTPPESKEKTEAEDETRNMNGPISSVENSTESDKCSTALCDAESALSVIVDPVGNKTGYVSRALGLPVSLVCSLVTQGRHVALPIIWRLPNGTEIVSDRIQISNVGMTDSGEYTCLLVPHECCANVRPDRVHLKVYELSEIAGIILMLSVLTSIAILVIVFIYSQKKKKYHSWLKHEILAASNSSGDSTPRSTLNRDMQTNSKKYLLNT